jgi:hypothetical protein
VIPCIAALYDRFVLLHVLAAMTWFGSLVVLAT